MKSVILRLYRDRNAHWLALVPPPLVFLALVFATLLGELRHRTRDYHTARHSQEQILKWGDFPVSAQILRGNCPLITGVTLPTLPSAVSSGHMSHNALVLCRQSACLKVLSKAFGRAAMDHEVCDSASDIMERMVRGDYSSLLLDFDLPGAGQVAALARMASPQNRPVLFALLGPEISVGAAFQAGANFVLYKPLELDPLEHSVRAAKAFMKTDRRRAARQKTEVLIYLQCGVATMPALAMDLSEQGLTLQAPEPLPPLKEMPLRFVLPGGTCMIEAIGEVIWADDNGRAGLFFSNLSLASRRQLKLWLRKRGAKSKNAVSVLLQPLKPRVARRASAH